ncbi:nSTAND1 domain-containing NTPase [Amycolatopsis silviterrae]|uniref:Novel STAND NTPase 1 domain-containing protein n=1 Tax=Amycolatopsis silviterrae TaxID=1656914 RepID=A0ABW5H3R3_9PSEU
MPREENPLAAGDGPLVEFARDLRLLREKAGKPPYRVLSARAHYSEAALSQAAAGRKLPSLDVTLAYVRACGGDRGEWERRWREASGALQPSMPPDEAESPYSGLAPFGVADAARFFGREKLVEDVLACLSAQRVAVVVGASGTGKTSLLRAGVVPKLTGPAVVLTPGAHPLEECHIHLARLAGTPVAAQSTEPRGLHQAVRRCVAEGSELVLVVDQFEEAFTLCADHAERARFIDQLLTAATTAHSGCRVILSVRADFYGDCVEHPALSRALRDGQVTVAPMTADELRVAVVKPAVRAGCVVETALVARIVSDAGGQHGVLPLVSHVLMETWRRRRGTTLTLKGYEAAGGIEHAVAHTAEVAFTALSAERRNTAQQVLLRLCTLGEGIEDTKRRARRDELDQLGGDVRPVLEHLAAARLVVLGEDSVEIAHEALIRSWPRLRAWLAEDREGLRVHRDLTDAAAAWRALDKDPGALYRGVRLALARSWAEDRDRALSKPERDFLTASVAENTRAEAAVRRRASQLRGLVALLIVLLLIAAGATWYALRAAQITAAQRNSALAQKVATQAPALRTADPALAGQLAVAAFRFDPTADTRGSLLSTVLGPRTTVLTGDAARRAVAFGQGGRVVASAGDSRTVRLWRLPSPHAPELAAEITGRSERVESLAFSPDGARLAAAGHDGVLSLWNVENPAAPRLLAAVQAHREAVYHVAFSPDGTALLTASNDGTAALWNVRDPSTPTRVSALTGHHGSVAWAEFAPGGRRAVTASDDGTVGLWDVTDLARPALTTRFPAHSPMVTSAVFSPDGTLLLTAGFDASARLWDLRAEGEPRLLSRLAQQRDSVQAARFSPDGRTVVTTGWDYTALLWDVSAPAAPTVLDTIAGHTNVVWTADFSPDGRVVATGGNDGTVRLADVPGRVLGGHTDTVRASVVSADGRTAATGSRDGTVRLWDVHDPDRPRRLALPASAMNQVRSLALNRNVLAAGDTDGLVRLWDVSDPAHARLLPRTIKHPGTARTIGFSPDGALLAVGGDDPEHVIRLWSLREPSAPVLAGEVTGATDFAPALAFSPRGGLLAAAMSNTVRLTDVSDPARPRLVATLQGHTDRVLALDFAPDGRHLVSSGLDRTARIWDVHDPRAPVPVSTLTGHQGAVPAVAYSPDGSRIATAGYDHTARLWEVRDLRAPTPWATLSGHTDEVHTVAFFPDGRNLLTGGRDGSGLLWRIDQDDAAAEACALAHPLATAEQLSSYFPDADVSAPCR